MAPLPGDLVGSVVDVLPDDDAAANTSAEDDTEHHLEAAAGAIDRLGEGEAVSVVGDTDRASEAGLEVGLERAADEPDGVGVLDQAGGASDNSWDADADGALFAGFGFQLSDEAYDRVDGGGVVARGWDPAAGGDDIIGGQGDGFDLGAAQINPDLHQSLCSCAIPAGAAPPH